MTILWYDLETWGLNPAWYPPAQFAGIRTDLDLNEIGDPVMFYAQPPSDMLPEPMAVLTTGITPQVALAEGVPEAEFAAKVNQQFSVPGTVTSGYNALRFDDEVMRYSFYRNLLDPYVRESYKNDLGRWDILDLVRAARALRPNGITWPEVDGEPSNRLEEITAINGIEHEGAHDALVDVRATIELAKLLKKNQPKLYDYGWSLRNKQVVDSVLSDAAASGEVLIHTSGKYPNKALNTSLVYVLGRRSDRKNEFLVYDLRVNPELFLKLNDSDLQTQAFGNQEDRDEALPRLPVKGVNVGKSPFVATADLFDNDAAKRIDITIEQAKKHRDTLIENEDFIKRLFTVFESSTFEPQTDVDARLYDGFASGNDRALLTRLNKTKPTEWPNPLQFDDQKFLQLVKRFVARNYPESLSPDDQVRWEQFRAQKLMQDDAPWQTYSTFSQELQKLAAEYEGHPGKIYLLEELHLYAESIYPDVS